MADQKIQYQTGFAPVVAPYAEGLLGAAQAASSQPYQSYQDYAKKYGLSGDQVAAFNPLQLQSFQQAQGLGGEGDNYSQRALQGIQALSGQTFGQPQAQQYMSPYIQSVIEMQQRDAQRQSDVAGTQQQAQATQAGGFGGSRDAIMRAERERNLALQKGDITATGMQNAFNAAQQQFNADQAKGLQGYSLLGQQGQAALGLQSQLGGQQQQQAQNLINVGQQNYAAEQNYPFKNLGFMSDIIRGVPLTQTGSSVYQAAPSMLSTVAGLGTTAAGALGAYNQYTRQNPTPSFAKGGAIKSKKPQGGLPALLLNSMG
jgi:hypothetical protein